LAIYVAKELEEFHEPKLPHPSMLTVITDSRDSITRGSTVNSFKGKEIFMALQSQIHCSHKEVHKSYPSDKIYEEPNKTLGKKKGNPKQITK
jgi:hypothetical protein